VGPCRTLWLASCSSHPRGLRQVGVGKRDPAPGVAGAAAQPVGESFPGDGPSGADQPAGHLVDDAAGGVGGCRRHRRRGGPAAREDKADHDWQGRMNDTIFDVHPVIRERS
jgi:hypothetical protein